MGCALYVDLLKPPSLVSLTLQEEKLDLVLGIKHIFKQIKSLKGLAGQDSLQWPTVKLVCSRIKDKKGGKQYQGATLKSCNSATLEYCKEQAIADVNKLDLRMRDRLEWSDVKKKSWYAVFWSSLILRDDKQCQTALTLVCQTMRMKQTLWRKSS